MDAMPGRGNAGEAPAEELSARELAEQTGTTVRTIHYYASEGLLPAPRGATRAATYSAAHAARLRLIAALREQGLSLAGIRARLTRLTDQQALDLAEALARQAAGDDTAALSPLGLVDAMLARLDESPVDAVGQAAAPAPPASAFVSHAPRLAAHGDVDSARNYLDRLLRKPSPAPRSQPSPQPKPQPRPQPPRAPDPSPRAEAWYHVTIADGIELRVREDRYYRAKGRLAAVAEAVRAALARYGLLGDDQRAADDARRRD